MTKHAVTGTPAMKSKVRKALTIDELKEIFFTSIDEDFYLLHSGAQTKDVLQNIRLIDNITIDNLIFTALFGVNDKSFSNVLSNTRGRKESFDERVSYGRNLAQTLQELDKEESLGILVDLFFIYPDGSREKKLTMTDILEIYYPDHLTRTSFFDNYDKGFYDLFGVKPFSKIKKNKEWISGMDNVTIDTYVFESLHGKPESYFDFEHVLCVQRKKIYNLRKKAAAKELSTAANFISKESKIPQILKAFMLAPKWSQQKDNALILLLKVVYSLECGGQKIEKQKVHA